MVHETWDLAKGIFLGSAGPHPPLFHIHEERGIYSFFHGTGDHGSGDARGIHLSGNLWIHLFENRSHSYCLSARFAPRRHDGESL